MLAANCCNKKQRHCVPRAICSGNKLGIDRPEEIDDAVEEWEQAAVEEAGLAQD